jgi:hypothetical protein
MQQRLTYDRPSEVLPFADSASLRLRVERSQTAAPRRKFKHELASRKLFWGRYVAVVGVFPPGGGNYLFLCEIYLLFSAESVIHIKNGKIPEDLLVCKDLFVFLCGCKNEMNECRKAV